MHEESLIVIKPGSQRVVYDGRFVATLINDLNAQTGTYDDAEKWALAGQYSTYFTGTIFKNFGKNFDEILDFANFMVTV